MKKSELKKISLKYRVLSSQMLKIDSEEEINYIKMYYDFINNTDVIINFIKKCHKQDYDFDEIYNNKYWNEILSLPDNEEALVDYGYQLIEYILSGKKQLYGLGQGYSKSNKIRDIIPAFMRKAIEPFVVSIKNYLEIELVDSKDTLPDEENNQKTIFLSYCQKDSDIADLIESNLQLHIKNKAKISRDIRDVEYHESFKRFMQSIEIHDYVIMVISDNYLKSRNCMFEVLNVVKDSQYQKKLVFIVLTDSDIQYYKNIPMETIDAKVYTLEGQTSYTLYWKSIEKKLQAQIDEIGDSTRAIYQIKEMSVVKRILLDLPDFFEFIKDVKGISLSQHIDNDFNDIVKFMKI